LLLAGCSVGPEYVEPDIDWRQEWETGIYEQIGSGENRADLELSFWWHLFDDPVLNDLVELAYLENLSLRIAGLRVLESRAVLAKIRGYQYPQVQKVTGDAAYVGGIPDGGDWYDDTTWGVGLDVGWEIDFWGRFRRGVDAADAAFFGSIANQQDFQVLLSAQVVDLYYSYRTTLLRLDIAHKNAAVQKQSFDITRRLYESGQESELDLQQARTQYNATLTTIPGFEQELRQVRNAICVLLGRPPGGLPELDEEVMDLPVVDPVLVEDIPAQLLIRRPDIRAAAAAVAAQTAQVGVAEAAKYPAISLFGTVGYSDNSLSLGIGPSLSWDIFNYGRLKNEVRVQDARLQQALENFQVVALEAAREIDDAAISVVKTGEQKHPQHESSLAAERSLELAQVRYREGYADFQRVIDAQRSAVAQTDREIVNAGSHISAIVTFYKAVGGGWRSMTFEELVPEETRRTMEDRTNWGGLLRDSAAARSDTLSQDANPESGE
jgi:NodT family efflux transporter outer membrane factor (OMF) lipoprotein